MSTSETRTSRRAKPADLRRTVRLFRTYAGPRGPYWIGCVLLVIEALTAVVEPIPIAYLVDYLQGARPSLRDELGSRTLMASEQYETILLLTLAIVLIAAINSAADSLTEVAMARGGRSLGYRIRVAMYSHLQRLPLAYHDTKRTGDVLTRVTGDVLVVEDFVVKSVSNILGSLLVLVGSFLFLLTQSWNVALVAIVVIPLLALVSNHYSRRIKVASRTQRDREGELASTAQEMLSSIRLVQSYGRGTVDLERFSGQTARSMRASLTAANIQAQFSWVIALVEALSISAVVWLGVWLTNSDVITIGTLVLFVLLLQNMFKPSRKIVSEWYKIGKVFASVERIEDLLDREIVVTDHPDARPAPALQGRLGFRHVGFTYPAGHDVAAGSRPAVLKDIDFDLAPGEVVALVGHSGAGKSTVAQLVPRLYDADEGEVLVDGLPVRELTLASLRAQVSLVLQDTVLLSGSVAENIGYGIAEATPDEIEEAARLANAHDFIMELPEGYATELGERGATLSGGQRQRLAIARAFIRRAPILILDEPTTGLDAESSRSVVEALQCLMQGTTTILISHDLALVRAADRVLVVAGGRITESGSPDQLIRDGGPYAELFAQQLHGAATERNGRSATRLRSGLAGGLGRQLPGMTRALDPDFATAQVRGLLRDPDAVVERASAGQLWLRGDGSCGLRYAVWLAGGSGPVEVEPVLGRLHRDESATASYVQQVQRLVPEGPGTDRRWRAPVTSVADVGLALHPFPLDPDLSTLPASMNPDSVRVLLAAWDDTRRPEVEVVHHPREGPCVLRYRFGGDPDRPADTYYGKVFGDGTGAAVQRFLQALTRADDDAAIGDVVRLPRPVAYSYPHRLLCTEALPGEPLRRLLGATYDGGAPGPERTAALAEAMATAGRALAALHRTDVPGVPAHSGTDELAALRHELELVATVWPTEAERIRRAVERLGARMPRPVAPVLSHGDFTPSQVLLDRGRPGVVDLDTLCRAEPALDLGRFLAHVRLLVAKLTGAPGATLVVEPSHAFLRGYCGDDGRTVAGDDGGRVAFYVGTTLARSALHACRQLKDERLEIALELLDQVPLPEEVEL